MTDLEYLERLGALSDEEFAEERAALDAAIAEREEHRAATEPGFYSPHRKGSQQRRGEQPPDEPEPPPSAEPAQPPPEPLRLEEHRKPPEPPVAVLPAGQHLEDHPSWRPAWREAAWSH